MMYFISLFNRKLRNYCREFDQSKLKSSRFYRNDNSFFVLPFQRLEQRNRVEAELRQRIEQLEKRQTQDDAVLNVVNRYWNQLNEDIRVLLQRFDAETADESENKS